MRKKAFTLLEVIVAITIFFVILVIIVGMYTKMMRVKYNIQARQSLVQHSYDAIEKINLLLKNYTIDYEEYFNRRNVGCNGDTSHDNFSWNVGITGYCSNFSAYGNQNAIPASLGSKHHLYYCSSQDAISGDPHHVIGNSNVDIGSGCLLTGQQSFGQYYRQGWDIMEDVDSITGAVGDGDDRNILMLPDAILNPENVQELYLISPDKKQRVFIRRALIESGDWNKDGQISGHNEHLYTLQILKLRGFDAGDNHDFSMGTSSGVYDSNTDTRACDFAQGFICAGEAIGSIYSGYALPLDSEDGRVNLFDHDLTVSEWNLMVYPTKHPNYSAKQYHTQLTPYFTISLTNKLYGKIWYKRLGMISLNDFQLTLQTTFSTKDRYTK